MSLSATSAQISMCLKSCCLTAILALIRWQIIACNDVVDSTCVSVCSSVLDMAVHPPCLQAHRLQTNVNDRTTQLLEFGCHTMLPIDRTVKQHVASTAGPRDL